MQLRIIIDEGCEEQVVVYARKRSEITEKIEQFISELNSEELLGYDENKRIYNIELNDVICFNIEDNKVIAQTKNSKLWIKLRMYQLEEELDEKFVKINQSCIINIKKIKKFDASISGTLGVTLVNGYTDYVSRRQLKTVKERLKL